MIMRIDSCPFKSTVLYYCIHIFCMNVIDIDLICCEHSVQ